MIATQDFPQADMLEQVGDVALAVAKGNYADVDIEKSIGLASAGRQGRYYRQAAEILGLITTSQNHSTLTPLGEEYVLLQSVGSRIEFLIRCVLETPVFQQAIAYIKNVQPTDQQLKKWFFSVYPGAQSTANRRYSTFGNYMTYLLKAKIISYVKGKYFLDKFIGAAIKQHTLVSKSFTKKAHIDTGLKTGVINVEIDAQKKERANYTHWNLVTTKAEFLYTKNYPAYENELIDLYSQVDQSIILYEMKSIFEGNFISQMRKAISQLYEYRYILSEPDAILCMVTNSPIKKKYDWVVDYLAKDRLIAYEWTEDFKAFECHEKSKNLLAHFIP